MKQVQTLWLFLELMTAPNQACLCSQVCTAPGTTGLGAALGLILCLAHDPVTEYQLISFHNNVTWISFEVQGEALYKTLPFPDSCCLSGTPAGRGSPMAVPSAVVTSSSHTEGQLQVNKWRGQGTELSLQQ